MSFLQSPNYGFELQNSEVSILMVSIPQKEIGDIWKLSNIHLTF